MTTILERKKEITSAGKYVEKLEPLYTFGGNVKWYSHYKNRQFLKKLNVKLLYNPSIPNLSKYPYFYTHVHSSILFKIAKR